MYGFSAVNSLCDLPPPRPPTAAVMKGTAFGGQPLPPSPPTGPAVRSFAGPPPLTGVPPPSNALPFRGFGRLPPPLVGSLPTHSPFTGLPFTGTPPHPPLFEAKAFDGLPPPFIGFKANLFKSHESVGPVVFGSPPVNLSLGSADVKGPELYSASSGIKHYKSRAAEKSLEDANILLAASDEVTPTQAEESLGKYMSTSFIRGGLMGTKAPFSFGSSEPSYVTQQQQQSGFSFGSSKVEADLQQEDHIQQDEPVLSMCKLKKKSAKMIALSGEEPVHKNEPSPEEDSSDSEITYGSGARVGLRSGRMRRSKKILKITKGSADSETLKVRWTKIFQLQHLDGYWEVTKELGDLINVDVDLFANVFLKNKGINSLGVTARDNILRLVATLLVLQLMRVEKLEEGKLLRTLFSLCDSSQPRPERWEAVKKAVDWVCWADHQYPCIYSRLEFGLSWESSTRQLLGYEALPPFSPLTGLNLQKTPVPLLVH